VSIIFLFFFIGRPFGAFGPYAGGCPTATGGVIDLEFRKVFEYGVVERY
jgi:hypothetical protein